jgi:septum formation protein
VVNGARVRIGPGSPLVLGSASPRRREILASLRIPHEVLAPELDEALREGEAPADYAARVAADKLAVVSIRAPAGRAVLTADTTVVLDGRALVKPQDDADAARMIAALAGRTHEVVTAFALGVAGRPAPLLVERVTTQVTFRPLEPREVDDYVRSGEGRDKAGGYAVQGLGAMLVSRLEGSYSNVVGLPACELWVALRRLGMLA